MNTLPNGDEIIHGCQQGDRESQRKLYELLKGKMYAICLRYSSNRDEAEDVLQEGFIKVYTSIKDFRDEGVFEGWVRRIMVNTALEHQRKKQRMYISEDIESAEEEFIDADIIDELSAREILALVQKLAPGYRLIFNLYVIEGYNHREIAEKLNISEGTSKSQLARAKKILQEQLELHQLVYERNVRQAVSH